MLRKITSLLAVLLVLALFAGCGSSVGGLSNGVAMDGAPGEMMDSVGPSLNEKGELDLESTSQTSRKLIRTVQINAETKEYDTFLEEVKAKVDAAGGYIEQSSENNSPSRQYRSASMTLRIPAGETDGLLALIGEMGTVTRQEESVKDVTLDYVDVQSHLKALRAEEESLLDLLENAESVGDIISIRDRLTTVLYEIEAYESTLRTFDNQVDYATVTLYVNEVDREVPAAQTMWQEIGGNLTEAVSDIGLFFRNAFVFLVSASPYLIVFVGIPGLILFLLIWISVKRHRKKKVLKAAQREEK